MEILEILFFLFSMFSLIHADRMSRCPASYCAEFYLSYPFKQPYSRPQNDCPYLDVACTMTQGVETPVINLPNVGNFSIQKITYYSPSIRLRDQGNCTLGRLMGNPDLSSVPLKAIAFENYTFYGCPTNISYHSDYNASGYPRVDCLSDSRTSILIASSTSNLREKILSLGCSIKGSWILPVSSTGQFVRDGPDGDLYLTWDPNICGSCVESYSDEDNHEDAWTKFAESPLYLPTFALAPLMLIFCSTIVMKLIGGLNETNSGSPTAHALPESASRSIVGGLDESRINACTELVVLTEGRTHPRPDSSTCSICLESFCPQDIARSIAKCEHCFHAQCIELWLRKNRTCPVCRIIVVDVEK